MRNLLLGSAACLVTMASASVVDNLLKVPLFEVGSIWIKATRDVGARISNFVFHAPDYSSPLTLTLMLFVSVIISYYFYKIFMQPMNRIRRLGDLGYVPEGPATMKEMANIVRKRRVAGDIPPPYPNGWFSVLESRDLKPAEVRSVSVLGLHLAVFRGEDGRAHVIDGYCPHLGAHLAVGGTVKGDCLECPFHGWRFRGDDGKCTEIPYSDAKIPDQAQVKSYIVLERNGFIYIWHHAENVEPYWFPPEIPEVTSGQWAYRGRSEHDVNSHIEEVPENGADLAHLPQVHGPALTAGTDLRYIYTQLWSFAKHLWSAEWSQDSEHKHCGTLRLTHSMSILGTRCPFLDMNVEAQQIGPGIVYLTFDSPIGKGAYLQSLTPVEPLLQKMIHQVYFQWQVPTVVGKFFLLSEAMMIERDIMLWNNKRYSANPVMVKSKEDAQLMKHRRWYSQFYSENSRKFKFQKDTLDW